MAKAEDDKYSQQQKALQPRKNSHPLTDETTRNTVDNERSGWGRLRSAASLNQLVSGVPRVIHAQREDMKPIVTYDGVEDINACAAKATSTYSHREVKVIVHKTSSSSSSTCSSVRSVDQRNQSARHKYERPRDHFPFPNRRQIEKRSSEQGTCVSADSRVVNYEQTGDSCTVERKSDYQETIQLQVLDITKDVTENEPSNEAKQYMKKQGGSLADIFDS